MFSKTMEYALRASVHLALHKGEAQTAQQIAESTQVPQGYLSKILQLLAKSELVTSQRGLGGGFVLRRPAHEISIFDVAQAVDPLPRIHTCPLALEAHTRRLCSLHARMDQAYLNVEMVFRQSTLQEMLDEPNPSRPLCGAVVLVQETIPV